MIKERYTLYLSKLKEKIQQIKIKAAKLKTKLQEIKAKLQEIKAKLQEIKARFVEQKPKLQKIKQYVTQSWAIIYVNIAVMIIAGISTVKYYWN